MIRKILKTKRKYNQKFISFFYNFLMKLPHTFALKIFYIIAIKIVIV